MKDYKGHSLVQTSFTEPPNRHKILGAMSRNLSHGSRHQGTVSTPGHCLRTRAFSRHQTTMELLSLSLSLRQEQYIYADNVQVLTRPMSQHQTTCSLSLPPLSLFTRARARSLSTPEQCLYLRAMPLSGHCFSLCARRATPLSVRAIFIFLVTSMWQT